MSLENAMTDSAARGLLEFGRIQNSLPEANLNIRSLKNGDFDQCPDEPVREHPHEDTSVTDSLFYHHSFHFHDWSSRKPFLLSRFPEC